MCTVVKQVDIPLQQNCFDIFGASIISTMLDDNLNNRECKCVQVYTYQSVMCVLKAQLSRMLAESISVRVNVLNKGTNLSSSPCCSDLKSLVQPSLAALSLCVCACACAHVSVRACVCHNPFLCLLYSVPFPQNAAHGSPCTCRQKSAALLLLISCLSSQRPMGKEKKKALYI